MTTGLTCIVEEKDDCSFAEFVWRCARQFGALAHMRDSSIDAPIKLTGDRLEYEEKRVAEALAELDMWQSMTPEEAEIRRDAAYAKAVQEHADWARDAEIKRTRLQKMRNAVEAWKPPSTEHEGLKRLMVEQLDDSVRWAFGPQRAPAPKDSQPIASWLRDRIKRAMDDLERNEKSLADARRREFERETWLTLLVDSVGVPTAGAK